MTMGWSPQGRNNSQMPEMPEVEVTRLSLGPRIRGGRVTGVRLGKPLRWPLGCTGASLLGQTVGETVRRGKYLWLPLDRGGLLLHLGMSGSLSFAATQARILDALWPVVRPGGKLLYVTCSVFPAENGEQIGRFLERQREAVRCHEEQLLPSAEHDGFYYCLLEKSA